MRLPIIAIILIGATLANGYVANERVAGLGIIKTVKNALGLGRRSDIEERSAQPGLFK